MEIAGRAGIDNMEDAGQKLKRVRERLKLRYRDVEEASLQIANRRKNDEFAIALSRLADIENKGTVPSLYRLYSLCAIYRLELLDVLNWYGVNVSDLPGDAASIQLEHTHSIGFVAHDHGDVTVPLSLDPGIDLRRTTFVTRFVQRWGKLPLVLLNGLEIKNNRYAFVGTEDWSMYPIIQPGSLIVIEEFRRKIAPAEWNNEFDRPIYFMEHREGYCLGWCTLTGAQLIVQPHPSSGCSPRVFAYPDEVDILGQVVGVAMRLDQGRRRRVRS
jgi:transcriptional regulator with XRE-family HTH domain